MLPAAGKGIGGTSGGGSRGMVAYVYLLEEVPHTVSDGGPWTKIGCSRNPPEWRIGANLIRGNPRDLHLAAVYEFETEKAAYDAEGRAHEHFKELLHKKEWFRVKASTVAEWAGTERWRLRSKLEEKGP